MTTLTDTRIAILTAASGRTNRIALPLPERLRGGAAHKVVTAMLAKGLLEEIEAGDGEPVWRESDDGYGVTLIATHAAMEAIGVQPEPAAAETPDAAPDAAVDGEPAPADLTAAAPETAPTAEPSAPKPRKTREGTKRRS